MVYVANLITTIGNGLPIGYRVVFFVASSPAALSIMGARLLFNVREAAEKGLYQETNCPTLPTISETFPTVSSDEATHSRALEGTPVDGELEIEVIDL